MDRVRSVHFVLYAKTRIMSKSQPCIDLYETRFAFFRYYGNKLFTLYLNRYALTSSERDPCRKLRPYTTCKY